MIRVGVSPLIILINNSGYVIEEEIHAGPYNKISDWNYTAVVEGMAGSRKNLYTAKVSIHHCIACTVSTHSPRMAAAVITDTCCKQHVSVSPALLSTCVAKVHIVAQVDWHKPGHLCLCQCSSPYFYQKRSGSITVVI